MTNLQLLNDCNKVTERLFFRYSNKSILVQHRAINSSADWEGLKTLITSKPPSMLKDIRKYSKSLVLKAKGANKGNLRKLKQEHLKYFFPSGGTEVGSHEQDFKLNGCIQIDIDFKNKGGDVKAKAVKQQISFLDYVLVSAISPSGFGVKAIILTDNTCKKSYQDARKQVTENIANFLRLPTGVFDNIGFNTPSYIPYDTTAIFNDCPEPFKVKVATPQSNVITATGSHLSDNSTTVGTLHPLLYNRALESAFESANKGQSRIPLIREFIGTSIAYGLPIEQVENYIYSQLSTEERHVKIIADLFRRYEDQHATNLYRIMDATMLPAPVATLKEYRKNGKIITEKLAEKVVLDLIRSAQIVSPTGSGKTYYIANKVLGKRIIFCPTIGLVKEAEEKYGATPFYSKEKDIPDDCTFIATTYHSAENLAMKINPAEWLVFVDEAHQLTSGASTSYILEQLHILCDWLPLFRRYYLFTATPLMNLHPLIKSLPTIHIAKKSIRVKTVQHVYYKDRYKTASVLVKRILQKGNKVAILFNNKNKDVQLGDLIALLKELNCKYELINSDTKDTDAYRRIVGNGEMGETEVIICTTVLEMGNNIDKVGCNVDTIVIGAFHPTSIEQFSARFRQNEKSAVYILRPVSEKIKHNTYSFKDDLTKQAENSIQHVKQAINISQIAGMKKDTKQGLINHYLEIENATGHIRQIPNDRTAETLRHMGATEDQIEDASNPKYYKVEPDYLGISNECYRKEISYSNTDEVYMTIYLSRFGFKHLASEVLTEKTDAELMAMRKAEKAESKAVAIASEMGAIDSIINSSEATNDRTLEILRELDKPTKLQKEEIKLREFVESFCRYGSFENVAEQLKDFHTKNSESKKPTRLSTQRLRQINAQLKWDITKAVAKTHPQVKGTPLAIFLNEVESNLTINEKYSTGECLDIIRNAYKIAYKKERPVSKESDTYDLKLFGQIVGTENTKTGSDKRGRLITSFNPSGYEQKPIDHTISKVIVEQADVIPLTGISDYFMKVAERIGQSIDDLPF